MLQQEKLMTGVGKRIYLLGAFGAFALASCNQAKSPDAVQKDVTHAEDTGGKEVIHAEQKESNIDSRQENNVASAVDKANTKAIDAAVDTALAQADANKKVALAKCEALGGAQQGTCREEATAQYDLAKAQAKAIKSTQGH
jgi:hypothetical protein